MMLFLLKTCVEVASTILPRRVLCLLLLIALVANDKHCASRHLHVEALDIFNPSFSSSASRLFSTRAQFLSASAVGILTSTTGIVLGVNPEECSAAQMSQNSNNPRYLDEELAMKFLDLEKRVVEENLHKIKKIENN